MTQSKTPEEATSSNADTPPPPVTEGSDKPGAAANGDGTKTPEAKEPANGTATQAAAAEEKKEDEGGESALFPRGNPLRWTRGGVTAGIGIFFTYLLMAHNAQLRFGVPLGIAFVALAAWGIMDLLGTFDDPATGVGPGAIRAEGFVATTTTLADLAKPLATVGVSLFVYALVISAASEAPFPQWMWGIIVTAAFLGLVYSVWQLGVKLGPWKTDELGLERPLWQRHGFWLVVVSALLLLPCLGSYSLWDPWETHYGEVSREILARDDWISLWWAQDGWFWSKPILDFWIQAIFMATLGVHYQPDRMLQGWGGAEAHPEWVVRTPVFLLTILAVYAIYKGVSKVFGRRPAFIGALILATMPDWWFLSHQTMTDMPFVAPTTAAIGLLLYGLYTPEDERVRLYEVNVGARVLRFSAWHLVFGAILMAAIPQILYLFSRNLELVLHGQGPYGFRIHWDEFRSGSGMGNCGLPGNEACVLQQASTIPAAVKGNPPGFGPFLIRLFGAFEPALQALTWSAVLGFLLFLNWGERRVRRLAYLASWYFCALATMGKGPAGFGFPILAAFAYVAATKRWRELVHFEMVSGLCIILCVAIPWWVAMYVRHGSPFTDRLIFHDMVNRAFSHVHDTNEGDDTSFRFYIWQLGYALFPWTCLVPLGLVYALRRSDTADGGKGAASILLLLWFVFAFALFSFMGTKFHHYIFPAVPPAAMLLGIVLSDMLGEGPILEKSPKAKKLDFRLYLATVAGGLILAVLGVAHAWPGSVFGERDTSRVSTMGYVMSAALTAGGVALLVWAFSRFRTASLPVGGTLVQTADSPFRPGVAVQGEDPSSEGSETRLHEQLMYSAAAVSGALMLGIVGRDLIIKPDNADQPGAIRLLQLFTYNYRRPWPDTLDFSSILTGFTCVAVALGFALTVARIRKHVIIALLVLGGIWAAWGIDVYMVKTGPHWGQHEVIEAYYADRHSPDEPIVAYQMNWKGENFYTGNKIPAFVSSGATFTSWIKQEKEKGVKAMYFITEHGRIGGLKGEVGSTKLFKEITDKALCNKFVMIRVEF